MLNSVLCLSSFKLIAPGCAASKLVRVAKLALLVVSMIFRPSNGAEFPGGCIEGADNERLLVAVEPLCCCDESC